MTIGTDLLVGVVISSLVLLLMLGAYLTIRIVALLRGLGSACAETIGWDMGEVRLWTISGAWSLFGFVWSRRVKFLNDRQVYRLAIALRVVHSLYFLLFFGALAVFMLVIARA
jgi:hypothetical protein